VDVAKGGVMDKLKFKKNVDYKSKFKGFKMYEKQDKHGNTYMEGQLGNMMLIQIQKSRFGENEWIGYIVPVRYEKEEVNGNADSNKEG
jgi:hypothetical protein